MLNSSKIRLWIALLLLGGFALSIVHLFLLRYAAGDVYPPYSSLRADPLGTKAFFESLRRLPGLDVQRNLRAVERLPTLPPATHLSLGWDAAQARRMSESLIQHWEQAVAHGGRLIISFSPESEQPWHPPTPDQSESTPPSSPPEGKPADAPGPIQPGPQPNLPPGPPSGKTRRPSPPPPAHDAPERLVSLLSRWGVALEYDPLPQTEHGEVEFVSVQRQSLEDLPESVEWHTALYFRPEHLEWRAVYSRGPHPVLLERKLGSGSIVLSADSYYLSNQAMRQDRSPELLAWLIGPHARVLFDEVHLGVSEAPGLAGLARKYRLHGALGGLLLLAVLYVWMSGYSLVPPVSSTSFAPTTDAVAGRDSAAALLNLLRRSVPERDLLETCFAQWKAASRLQGGCARERLAAMEKWMAEERAAPAGKGNPVRGYRRLSELLQEERSHAARQS